MKNNYVIEIASKLETAKTRVKEIHWSSPSFNIHKITDDVADWIGEVEDSLIENMMAVTNDYIFPGELKCIPWESKELESFLTDFRGFLISIKREFEEGLMYSGIVNILDDAIQTVNMYIYQVRIAKHKAKDSNSENMH